MFSKQQGSTLIELLVTTVVVAVGLLGLARLLGDLLRSGGERKAVLQATSRAQEKIEQFRDIAGAGGYATLTAGTGSDNTTIAGINTNYTRSWQITDFTNPQFKRATVTVAWTDPAGTAQTVFLTSYISAITSYQFGAPPVIVPPGGGGGNGNGK